MKTTLAFLALISGSLVHEAVAIGHNGYVYDTSHSLDHKKDLDKLKHPNQHPMPQDTNIQVIESPELSTAEDEDDGGVEAYPKKLSRKALMMGARSQKPGYYNINSNAVALDNIVTNILEASAAVEREDVFSMNDRTKGGKWLQMNQWILRVRMDK